MRCAIAIWLLSAVVGVTVAVIGYRLGLWALGALIGGAVTLGVMGALMTMTFCRTDEEIEAARRENAEIEARRAKYRAADDDVKAHDGGRPAPVAARPVVPTVAASAPRPAPAPAARPEPAPVEQAPAAEVGTRPVALDGPRAGQADDLKRIKGVGPKLERLCNRLGFYHFDQIAAWTPDEIAWVDENLEGFKGRVSRDEWVAQARVLAEGGETEFSQKVDKGDVY
ncbi:hypothetical protein [Rhodovulum imhoffii]|uniref:hypothetical protein n=1 Tax=Rhodovulum imhoffii TaxID=365340 RepID=UPI001FD1D58C|nr:hypothetical protein [Rhodovulum imhoffii]